MGSTKAKKNDKNWVFWILFFAGAGVLMFAAYWFGQQRYIYQPVMFDVSMPIPIDYDQVSGTYKLLDDGKIRVDFSPVPIASGSEPFICVGYFSMDNNRCYLLLRNGKRVLERAEFVDPILIEVLKVVKQRQRSGAYPVGLSRRVADYLPKNAEQIDALLAQMSDWRPLDKNLFLE